MSKLDARRSRDDAALALLLAAGERARRPAPVRVAGSADIEKRGSDVALVLGSRGGSTRRWRRLRAFVLRRDGERCQRCGSAQKLECHHLVPRTAGGRDVPSNCRALCVGCHDALHGR